MQNKEFNTNIWNAQFNCPFCLGKTLNYYHVYETEIQTITCPDCKNILQVGYRKFRNSLILYIRKGRKQNKNDK